MTSTSNEKLLDVLEYVIAHCEVTPLEIQTATGLSRTAVHRALKILEKRNILRIKLGNGSYMICSSLIKKISKLPILPPKLERLIPEIYAFCKGHNLHCDYFGPDEKKIAKLIETSDPSPENIVEALLRSPLMILSVSATTPITQLSSVLKKAYPELDKYTLHQTRNWALSRISQRKDHIFEVQDMTSVLIGLTLPQTGGYVVNIRPRPNKAVSMESLRKKAMIIQSMASVV